MPETITQSFASGTGVKFVGNMQHYPHPVTLPEPPVGKIICLVEDENGNPIAHVDFGPGLARLGCTPSLWLEDLVKI